MQPNEMLAALRKAMAELRERESQQYTNVLVNMSDLLDLLRLARNAGLRVYRPQVANRKAAYFKIEGVSVYPLAKNMLSKGEVIGWSQEKFHPTILRQHDSNPLIRYRNRVSKSHKPFYPTRPIDF